MSVPVNPSLGYAVEWERPSCFGCGGRHARGDCEDDLLCPRPGDVHLREDRLERLECIANVLMREEREALGIVLP